MLKSLKFWLILIIVSIALVPLIVYIGGSVLAGPYEGKGGLPGLFGEIFSDALQGNTVALSLLFSPAILLAIWASSYGFFKLLSSKKSIDEKPA